MYQTNLAFTDQSTGFSSYTCLEPFMVRFVGRAYLFDARECDALIFMINGEDYVMPVVHVYRDGKLSRTEVRSYYFRKILSRIGRSNCIMDMELSKDVSEPVQWALTDIAHAWFQSGPDYDVVIEG